MKLRHPDVKTDVVFVDVRLGTLVGDGLDYVEDLTDRPGLVVEPIDQEFDCINKRLLISFRLKLFQLPVNIHLCLLIISHHFNNFLNNFSHQLFINDYLGLRILFTFILSLLPDQFNIYQALLAWGGLTLL
jgi:hypothetical protein